MAVSMVCGKENFPFTSFINYLKCKWLSVDTNREYKYHISFILFLLKSPTKIIKPLRPLLTRECLWAHALNIGLLLDTRFTFWETHTVRMHPRKRRGEGSGRENWGQGHSDEGASALCWASGLKRQTSWSKANYQTFLPSASTETLRRYSMDLTTNESEG